MARYRDWAGWMATVEEVEEDPKNEEKALDTIIRASSTPEEAAEVALALGLGHLVTKKK